MMVGMSMRGRLTFGALFAVAGAAAWVVLVRLVEPLVDEPPDRSVSFELTRLGAHYRWSAILLTTGGLLLMARGTRPGIWLAPAIGASWLAADLALDLSGAGSAVAVVVGALLTAAVLAVAVVLVMRRAIGPMAPAWSLLSFAAFAAAFAPVLAYTVNLAGSDLPTAATVTLGALPAVLLIAALLAAAAVRPVGRWLLPVVLAAVGLAAGVWVGTGSLDFLSYDVDYARQAFGVLFAPVATVVVVALASVAPRGLLGFTGLLGGALAVVHPVVLEMRVGEGFWRFPPGPYAIAVGAVTTGLVAAAVAVVVGRFARQRPEPTVTSVYGSARAGWRSKVGYPLALLGIVAWAVAAGVVEPLIRDLLADDADPTPSFDEGADLALLGRDLRWASMVLAVGGLVLLARAYGRQVAVALGVAGWIVGDLVLDALNLDGGWPVAAGAGAAVAVGLLVLARPRGVLAGPPPARAWPVVYSGVSVLVATLLLSGAAPWMPDQLPAWVVPAAVALSVLLVLAGVLNALAVVPRIGWGRALVALAVVAGGGALVVAVDLWAVSASPAPAVDWVVDVALPFVMAVPVLACALLAGGLGRSLLGWCAFGVVAVASVLGTVGVLVSSVQTSALAQTLLRRFVGATAVGDGRIIVVAGIMAGTTFAMLALLPRALSTPDDSAPLPAPPPAGGATDLSPTLVMPGPAGGMG